VSTKAQPTTRTDQDADRRSIVVGTDSRGRSASAVVWAVDHAEREHRVLRLVTATHAAGNPDDSEGHDLGTLARRLSVAEVDQRDVVGDTVDVLLDAASKADLLVVGSRPMGATKRLVLGSTSRAVATWSPVPVVIVPEAWVQPGMAASPVVVGVRPDEQATPEETGSVDAEVLRFGFERAEALHVPLVVVSAYEPAWLQTWSPEDLAEARARHDALLAKRLGIWSSKFPDVEVTTKTVAEPADHAVAEASRIGQLVVIGRHHSQHLTGLLGSTARGVLKSVGCPVAVVPAGSREELLRAFDLRQSRFDQPWVPTY
jgi:nucleotide-binding universal stress UspA family protein